MRAYKLQERGRDTVDANTELGLPVDGRNYGIAAQILLDLGVTSMQLLTNNPAKCHGMEGFGLDFAGRTPLPPVVNPENLAYLWAKRNRMGHLRKSAEPAFTIRHCRLHGRGTDVSALSPRGVALCQLAVAHRNSPLKRSCISTLACNGSEAE
jgi:hypothetical protein